MYDAIVIGARCAGAATAMLLARQGHRVLLLDRGVIPSDVHRGPSFTGTVRSDSLTGGCWIESWLRTALHSRPISPILETFLSLEGTFDRET